LVELLVVVSVIVVMTGLAVPAFNAIRGGADFTSEIYDIAGTLQQGRAYAIANNTYVLVGMEEVSSSLDTAASPQVSGIGRIAVAIVASKSGTRPYQSLINGGTLSTWETSAYGSGSAFEPVINLMSFPNLHLVDLQNSGSAPPESGNMARPAVTMYYNLSSAMGTSSTEFAWPLGTKLLNSSPEPQYVFTKVIEFDPGGTARVISTANPPSYPDAIPQYLEIGLQPTRGGMAAGPPSSQAFGSGEIAAIQINGITGAVNIYRP
jgi:type II secretory pathway pseudopilin PulG